MQKTETRFAIIVNPGAGSAEQFERLKTVLSGRDHFTYQESLEAGHCTDLTQKALADGCDVIVAAGGDGTVNEVVNGIMRYGRKVRFGLIPLGTGNDLARTLAIPNDPRDAVALLEIGQVRKLDLIQVQFQDKTKYGINVAAGGFSGQMNEALTPELKATWGPLAYLVGAVTVMPDMKDYQTYLRCDDGELERVEAVNIILGNGRTAAGGKPVAPLANPEDGLLDLVIIKAGSALELTGLAARVVAGNYLESPQVLYRKVRRAEIASVPGMWFNVDGELLTNDPVVFTALPGALEVVVGTDYVADPPPASS